MNKLWIIIKREYLTRVQKRSFILATLLTPLAFALFFVVVGFIFSVESDERYRVAVLDEAGIYKESGLADEKNLQFVFEKRSLKELRENYYDQDYDGILLIPEIGNVYSNNYTVFYYAPRNPTPDVSSKITGKLTERIREYKIEVLGLDKKSLDALKTKVEIDPEPIQEGGADSTKLAGIVGAAIGGGMGFIMYLVVFIYGMMVMRSVMEEKTTRIVEVMISSVKPFQLMLGKIVGVGAVGLTQLLVWAILIPLLSFIVTLLFGFDTSQMEAQQAAASGVDADEAQAMIAQAIIELKSQNWWVIMPLFIFYFLGGYFLYASMFAAVGSAMSDDMGESQSLTIPITIPVIIAFYIMMMAVESPNSSMSVWASIFPLFSPIVMPARLAFDPAWWQVGLSMVLLLGTCLFFVWLAGRIYRVGILLYGKKVTLKELGKWMFVRD
jgi:ABC-2 type transport system permease protein